MSVLLDRDPPGCHCTPACPWPCWQRVGLHRDACCPGCPPLPDPDQPTITDQQEDT